MKIYELLLMRMRVTFSGYFLFFYLKVFMKKKFQELEKTWLMSPGTISESTAKTRGD